MDLFLFPFGLIVEPKFAVRCCQCNLGKGKKGKGRKEKEKEKDTLKQVQVNTDVQVCFVFGSGMERSVSLWLSTILT